MAAEFQRFTYVVLINLAHYYGKGLWQPRAYMRSSFPLCASVVPRPMDVVFDLGTRLGVRMRTKLENGVLHNEQQPQSVVNGFY